MTDLPTPPKGFTIVPPDDQISEIPEGYHVVDQPTPPAGFELMDQPKPKSKAYQAEILPARRDEQGNLHWAVPGFVTDIVDAVTLPGDVLAGRADVSTPEGFNRAMGLSTLLVGGRAPVRSTALVTDEAGRTLPKAVTKALGRDQIPLGDVAARVKDIGPDAVVGDLGPNSRNLAAALATKPGAGQKIVMDTLTARRDAAPARLTGALDDVMGEAPIPSRLHTEIRANQRAVGPLYDQALAAAQPVDTSGIAGALDQTIPELRGPAQAALQSVRAMLNETGTQNLDSRASTLFQVRRAVDGMLDGERDGNVKKALGDVRRHIDDVLDGAAPAIKEIDARYKELIRQGDAVDRGQTVLGNGRTDPRPVELAEEVAAGAAPAGFIVGPSGVAFRLRQGARAEIDRIVGTNLNDRAALNSLLKGNSDWNYQRLSTLFGPERTDRLYRLLENERAMAETENHALAGSKTAAVRAAQNEVDGNSKRPGAVTSLLDFHPGSAAATLIDRIMNGFTEARDATQQAALARTMMGKGDWQTTHRAYIPVDTVIQAIMGHQWNGDPGQNGGHQ
jgi:hypothetical protein